MSDRQSLLGSHQQSWWFNEINYKMKCHVGPGSSRTRSGTRMIRDQDVARISLDSWSSQECHVYSILNLRNFSNFIKLSINNGFA